MSPSDFSWLDPLARQLIINKLNTKVFMCANLIGGYPSKTVGAVDLLS